MRIREIEFYNFRCFRGHRRISFVDPLTDAVRPVTVLAGSNGSGKTTILEAISAMLALVVHPDTQPELVREVGKTSASRLQVELTPEEISPASRQSDHSMQDRSYTLDIVVGREHLPVAQPDVSGLRRALQLAVMAMEKGQDPLRGGVLFFPHDRELGVAPRAVVKEAPPTNEWLFRFAASKKWEESLEQLWVWENYLDLEEGTPNRSHLAPYVESVEHVLGEDRSITISKGRVRVDVPWRENDERATVRLNQLPSGEQQVLLLFGELARRRRAGPVILIDEVENSLHPTLQRLVMWNLHRIAREWDAQVIVATHSLEVINTVRGGAFINLDYPEDRFDLPVPPEDEEAA